MKRRPRLTLRKFTARNARSCMTGSYPLSGLCTVDRPFGQCTSYLPDDTPVDRKAFLKAVLDKLSGHDADASARCLRDWERRMAHLSGREAA